MHKGHPYRILHCPSALELMVSACSLQDLTLSFRLVLHTLAYPGRHRLHLTNTLVHDVNSLEDYNVWHITSQRPNAVVFHRSSLGVRDLIRRPRFLSRSHHLPGPGRYPQAILPKDFCNGLHLEASLPNLDIDLPRFLYRVLGAPRGLRATSNYTILQRPL